MKMKHRALALMLSAMMVLTFMPALAFAEEPKTDEKSQPVAVEEIGEETAGTTDTQEVTEPEEARPQELLEKEEYEEAAPESLKSERKDAEECQHLHTQTIFAFDYADDLKYEAIDNSYHKITGSGYDNTYCMDCGMLISQVRVDSRTEQRSHIYDEKGVCGYCGHNNTCEHKNTNTWFVFDYEKDFDYEAIDNQFHNKTGSGYDNTHCMDCSMMVGHTLVESHTEKEPHFYDDKGVCTKCGHKNTCTHKITESWFSFDDYKNIKFASIDNKYHSATGSGYEIAYCQECGTEIGREYMESHTEKYWHDYNNGTCEDCGHKNTCKHNTNKDTWLEFDVNAEYTAIDNKYHSVTGSGYELSECSDCGELLSEAPFDNRTEKEEHDYSEDGVCYRCGHKSTCNHSNTSKLFGFYDGEKYTPIDSKYHQVTGDGVEYIECNDCGIVVSYELVDNHTEKREHRFDNSGTCLDCGYKSSTPVNPTPVDPTPVNPTPVNPQPVNPQPAPIVNPTTPTAPVEIIDLPAVKISKPKVAKKKITVKWKKVSKKNLKKISGIQIQVATDPGFTNIVKTATAGKKKTSKAIKGLQPKTKYYVRIRAYAAGDHYSVWKSKSAKVK